MENETPTGVIVVDVTTEKSIGADITESALVDAEVSVTRACIADITETILD